VAVGALAAIRTAVGAVRPDAPDAQWLAYGNGPQVTSWTPATSFPTADVSSLRRLWTAQLDGRIVAQPLAADVPELGGLTFFASTMAGSVYALDIGGHVRWHVELGAVQTAAGCGTYGIASTGVIDVDRGVLYVANADGYVHALRLADGAEGRGWPARVTARPLTEYVWGGLTLLDNRLYVPIASYCDARDADGVPGEGGVYAFRVDRPAAAPAFFDPVPGDHNLGGVWGWGGVSVAPDGKSLYFGVGNADPDVDNGYSDSMVQLTPDFSRVLGASRPPGAIPGADIDLGAAPVLFQPTGGPALLAANDKDGTVVVWRQNELGRGVYARVPVSNGVFAFVGAPSWSPRAQMLYVGGAAALDGGKTVVGTQALGIGPNCTIVKRWFYPTGNGTQPQPLVAGDLVFTTGGTRGGFYALDADTGRLVWRFDTAAGTWSPPMAAGGVVVSGDLAGNLYGFYPRVSSPLRMVR
jgi:outer membrane protein assembly factor BamB